MWHDDATQVDARRHVAAAQRHAISLPGKGAHGQSAFTQKCSSGLRPLCVPRIVVRRLAEVVPDDVAAAIRQATLADNSRRIMDNSSVVDHVPR
jgi:hypothetical protein